MIHAHVRDGMANPIIPGSSLKGALRTAIVRKLAMGKYRPSLDKAVSDLCDPGKKGPTKKKEADKDLLNKILGKEPNTNLMRLLTVGDFTFSPQDIGLQSVRVSRLDSPTGKQLTPKKNKSGKPMSAIVVEKISANSIGCAMISFDDYLATACNTERRYLDTKEKLDLPWLIAACQALSDHTIKTELDFFKDKTGSPAEELFAFYSSLKQVLDTLEKDKEAIIQMAWGSGWRGMTGQLVETEQLDTSSGNIIREKLELASKYLGFPFPKSRKAALPEDNHNGKILPMGWVKLTFTPMEEVREAAQEKQRQIFVENEKRKQAEAAKDAMLSQWEAMSEAERDLACIRQNDIARKFAQTDYNDPYQAIWKRMDSATADHKRQLAFAFRERWQKEGRWKVKNKKSKQYEKVIMVMEILNAD